MDALAGMGSRPRRTMPLTMCRTSASGCSSVTSGAAAVDRRRAQSVLDCTEVDLGFAPGCLAERDDADLMIALRVDYGHRDAGEQAERDEALLAVGEPIILEGVCRAFEHARGIDEVEAVGRGVRDALG